MIKHICALLFLIIEIDFSLQKEISMILVGYLVKAAPQIIVWWGGFFISLYTEKVFSIFNLSLYLRN